MVFYQKTNLGKAMPRPRNLFPQYSLHKKSGLARCVWQGDTVYLGKHNTPESFAAYNQILALFNLTGKIKKEERLITVDELVNQFLNYLKASKEVSQNEIKNMGFGLRYVQRLFGNLPANNFKVAQMILVRDQMVENGLRRTTVVKYQRYINRCWRWGVRSELVTGTTFENLKSLESLKKNRSHAKESDKVKPVKWEDVAALESFVCRQIWAMILLQWHTGMRPGEVVLITPADIQKHDHIWIYRPHRHKTDYRGKDRIIAIGKKAQEVLNPWLCRPNETPCFSPGESQGERYQQMRASRKSKVQPSQLDRSKSDPKRAPGQAYQVSSYRRAITKACEKAQVETWTPNQIRHTFATRVRKEFGLDAAQVALGHEHANVTQIYAEKDIEVIKKIAEKLG